MKRRLAVVAAALAVVVGFAAPGNAATNNVRYTNPSAGWLQIWCANGPSYIIAAPADSANYCWTTTHVQANGNNIVLRCYTGFNGGSWTYYGKAKLALNGNSPNCRTSIG